MTPRFVLVFLVLSAGAVAFAPPTYAESIACVDGPLCVVSAGYAAGCGMNATADGETCTYGVEATTRDPTSLGAGDASFTASIARGHVHGQNAYNDWAQDGHAATVEGPANASVASHGYASAQEPLTDAQAAQAERRVEARAQGETVWVDASSRTYAESLQECRLAASGLEPPVSCPRVDPVEIRQQVETLVAGLLP